MRKSESRVAVQYAPHAEGAHVFGCQRPREALVAHFLETARSREPTLTERVLVETCRHLASDERSSLPLRWCTH